jgi:hypothetical protein
MPDFGFADDERIDFLFDLAGVMSYDLDILPN